MQIVRQRARLKTIIQSILHAHLVPPCPHADLLGPRVRSWLLAQPLPPNEADAVARHLREHERLTDDLRIIEREIARCTLVDPDAQRLMTIPGIDMVVAVGLLAAIWPNARFEAPDKLVSYLGLNSTVYQSGEGRPRHGRTSKQGRTHARTMLVEAAWQAVRGPGPLRAFYERCRGAAASESRTRSRKRDCSTSSVVQGWLILVKRCSVPFSRQRMSNMWVRKRAVGPSA